jgi:hypothetical protein
LISAILLGIAAPALASGCSSASNTQGQDAQTLEVGISGNGGNMNMGEPEIAVNPRNQNELYVDGATFPVPLIPNGKSPVPYTCEGWASDNGGLSWQPAPVPVHTCEDGEAVFGPDGTLYAGGDEVTSTSVVSCSTRGVIKIGTLCVLVPGVDPVLRSTDGGHTWTDSQHPVLAMGSTNLGKFTFASGHPSNTFDRPWLAVDQSTNTVYAAGHNLIDHEGFVTASTNEARSFGPIYAVDSPDYPSGGLFGGTIAAARGVLGAAYSATRAPDGDVPPGVKCPCVIFETSTDQGKTFLRHVVPTTKAASPPDPFVAADPAAPGRFAVTILNDSGTQNQIYVTDDNGASWHGPTTVGAAGKNQLFKPWLAYGPSGQLALVWRVWHGSPNIAPYDVWAAVGRDGGTKGEVFGAPVRVTAKGVAAAPYPAHYSGGDDFSFIIPTKKYVHIGWGDSRDVNVGGGVQVWYARLPLSAFH